MTGYGMSINLSGTMEEVKVNVVDALKAQGFGVVTEINMQNTLKQKLGVDFEPYLILGACNPGYAYRALSADISIGLLLPCNVVIRQDHDEVVVSIQDPEAMFSVVDKEIKQSLVRFPQEVKTSLQSVLTTLKSQESITA